MDAKVLIPLDDSPTSAATLDYVLAHPARFASPLILLHVVDVDKLAYRMIPDFQLNMVKERARESGEEFLAEQLQRVSNAGLQARTRLETGSPRKVIPRVAEEEEVGMLVIGRSHAGEIRDVLFGSVTNYVLHQVRCPVLLV